MKDMPPGVCGSMCPNSVPLSASLRGGAFWNGFQKFEEVSAFEKPEVLLW
jgi:hypothetical protein